MQLDFFRQLSTRIRSALQVPAPVPVVEKSAAADLEETARHFYRCPACATVLRRVRPLRGKSACLACCRQHMGGSYSNRFRFVKIAAPAD